MVNSTSDPMDTAFTVSVDYKGKDVTTGISAADRSRTIRAMIEKKHAQWTLPDLVTFFP